MISMEQYNSANNANIAKLRQLAQDAANNSAKLTNAGQNVEGVRYSGIRDGLLRAVRVLEGKG